MPISSAERSRRWRERHPETHRARAIAYGAKRDNAGRSRAWREAAPEKRLAYNAANLHRHAAQAAKRRAVEERATPSWADLAAIEAIYAEARSAGVEVDHIVPLRSTKVCGLHCPANLQLLDPLANRRKRNLWWPDMFEDERDV